MKKRILSLTLALLGTAALVQAQKLDEVLKNYFEVNGQEALLEAKNSVTTGKMLQMGMEFPFKQYAAAPSRFRVEATFQGMMLIQTYNGKEGWTINPFAGLTEPQPMGEMELKAMALQADFEGMLWNYAEKGYQVTLEGTKDVEGAECYVIRIVTEQGDEFLNYLDTESFVMLKSASKMDMDGTIMESETYMSNYQQGDGYVFPGKIETRVNGQVQNTIILETMEIGLDLDDAIFEKPQKVE